MGDELNPTDGRLEVLKRINEEIERLSPILLSLRPVDFSAPAVPASTVARSFVDPGGQRYVILANTDVTSTAVVEWGADAVDMLTGNKARGPIELVAGGGKLLRLL